MTRLRDASVTTLALLPLLGGCPHPKARDAPRPECRGGAGEQAAPARLEVPRRGDLPALDGRCDDEAYAAALDLPAALGRPAGALRVVHSGLDLYLCAERLPAEAQRLVFRFDVDHDRGEAPTRADVTLIASRDGGSSLSSFVDGSWRREALARDELEVQAGPGTFEVRIPLARLGGYAHVSGLQLAVEEQAGRGLSSWPGCGLDGTPSTWGELALGPLYDADTDAASAFLDGQGGHLIVPAAPELDPQELTFEGWVRAAPATCGTLLSSGPGRRLWVGLCGGVHLIRDGEPTLVGKIQLDDRWHHVAVTAGGGRQAIFVDGQLDVASGPPEEGERPREAPVAGGALRLGADPSAPDGMTDLHGNVAELRLWRRALTAEELGRVAFQPPARDATDLVAYWPLRGGLSDLVAGHHAGLIGDASLAREAPQRTAFVPPAVPPPYTYQPVTSVPAWSQSIPMADQAITVDGQCTEYGADSRVGLGAGELGVHLVVTADSLHLCTGPLLGREGTAVRLLVAPQGSAPPLDIELTPDGRIEVSRDGSPVQADVTAKAWTTSGIEAGPEQQAIKAPLWGSEARIPLSLLSVHPGGALRLGLLYTATLPASDKFPKGKRLNLAWPVGLDLRQLDRLPEVVLTSHPPGPPGQPPPFTAPAALTGPAPGSPPPRPSPTTKDLIAVCPELLDNPAANLGYITVPELKWPLIDGAHAVARVEGNLEPGHGGIHVSPTDAWTIHSSHDVDMHLTPAPSSRWAALNGERMVMETESAGFPDYARPAGGDHVVAVGRWTFDCGHNDDPKTELHPIFAMASDHLEVRSLTADGPPRTMTIAKVWMNSRPSPFGDRATFALAFDVPFEFDVDLPWEGLRPSWMGFVSVLHGDPARVSYTLNGTRVHFRVTAEQPGGTSYFEIAVGHLSRDENLTGTNLYTFTIDSIKAINDHDSFPRGDGEWFFDLLTPSGWRSIWRGAGIDDGRPAYPVGHRSTFFRYRDAAVPLQVSAYEDDSPRSDSITGLIPDDDALTSGVWQLPLPELAPGASVKGQFCPAGDGTCAGEQWKLADWQLQYTLQRGGNLPGVLGDDAFWAPRLRNEPDDSCTYPCWPGKVKVPAPGQPAAVVARDAFISERPLRRGQVALSGSDVDVYNFEVDDFADVALSPLPAGLTVTQSKSEWFGYGIPAAIQSLLGPQSYRYVVKSASGAAGDVPYRLEAQVRPRPLPPDEGESQDPPAGSAPTAVRQGRVLRLADPGRDPATEVYPGGRRLSSAWSWFHVTEDEDWYDVQVELPAPRPDGQPACEFDELGGLQLRVYSPRGIRVDVPRASLSGSLGWLDVDGEQLRAGFADGHVLVRVRPEVGRRTVYLVAAEWTASAYFDPKACKEEKERRERELRWALEKSRAQRKGFQLRTPVRPRGDRPVLAELPFGPTGGASVLIPDSDRLDVVLAAPEAQAIGVRLYDAHNVLLGESEPLAGDAANAGTVVDGLVAQGRLRLDRLRPGERYLLQLVPRTAGSSAPDSVRVGMFAAP